MAHHIPPPPIYPRANVPLFDLPESDDEIIDVYTESELESEPEPQPAAKPQRAKKAQPATETKPASLIETTYECWKLTKAPTEGRDRPSWKRAERNRLSLPSDELAQEAKRHRKTNSVTNKYDALSADQREHVELVVKEKRRDEKDPNAEWELANIHRQQHDNYKTKVRETTYIRVILRRQDKRQNKMPEKPKAEAVVPGNIVDLNDRARILSLESETSKKAPEARVSSKDKDQKHKRKDSKKVEIIVDGGKGPAYPSMGSGSKNPPFDQAARPTYGQNQSSRQVPEYPRTEGLKYQFPNPPMFPQTQDSRSSTQTQTSNQQQAPSTQESWAQRQAQSAQQPHPQPQQPGMQHPNQPGYQFPPKTTLFGVQQPGQSTVPGHMNTQQTGAQPSPSMDYQRQAPVQQPGLSHQMPSDFQRPGQTQQPGAQHTAQPNAQHAGAQGIFAGFHQSPQQNGAQQQPLSSFDQPPKQATAQFPAYAAVNSGVPQSQPQPQSQAYPVSHNYPQPQQQATQPPQTREFQNFSGHNTSTGLPTGSNANPGQPLQAGMGGHTGLPTANIYGRFSASNLQGPGRADVTAEPNTDPRFAGVNLGRPDLQRGVSAGATPNYTLPRMGQQNVANDDRVLQWQSQAHIGHSRSSSSFDEHSSAIPSVDTPRTSNSGYPSELRYPRQPAGYRFPSDQSSGYVHGQREKVNVLPARSGRREDKPIRLSQTQQQERPVIVQKGRRDRSVSRSPVRRSEKKKSKKKSNRKDESSSESSDSGDDDQYERSSKRSSKRSGKEKRRSRKEDYSSESYESDSEDGHYKLSSRSRGSKSGNHSSRRSGNRPESPKRRPEKGHRYDTRPQRTDEAPSYTYGKDSRADPDTASVVEMLKRLQEMEERQAEEMEKKRREAERREAYEKGLEDAWKKSRPSGFSGF